MSWRVLRSFLSTEEREHLVSLAEGDDWKLGRLGTGYEKRELAEDPVVEALTARALEALGATRDLGWDRYLLRYDADDRAPEHLDEAPNDSVEHHRLNALVQAGTGGSFVLEGERVALEEGDGVIFRPDLQLHAVEAMRSGVRLVFSVGVNLRR